MGIFGSKSKSKESYDQTGNTIYNVDSNALPVIMDEYKPLYDKLASGALDQLGKSPEELVPELNPMMRRGINGINRVGTEGLANYNQNLGIQHGRFADAANMYGGVGNISAGSVGAGDKARDAAAMMTSTSDVTGGDVTSRLNPYIGAFEDTTLAKIQKQNAIQQAKLAAKQAGSKAFGDRSGLEFGNLLYDQNLATQGTLADIYKTGFNTAQDWAQTDRARALKSQVANQSADLSAQQGNQNADLQYGQRQLDASRISAELALEAAKASEANKIAAAKGLTDVADTESGVAADYLNNNLTAEGAVIQAGALDQDIAQRRADAPMNNLNQVAGIAFGAPIGQKSDEEGDSTTNQSGTGSSSTTSFGVSFAQGGRIPHFANGGALDFLTPFMAKAGGQRSASNSVMWPKVPDEVLAETLTMEGLPDVYRQQAQVEASGRGIKTGGGGALEYENPKWKEYLQNAGGNVKGYFDALMAGPAAGGDGPPIPEFQTGAWDQSGEGDFAGPAEFSLIPPANAMGAGPMRAGAFDAAPAMDAASKMEGLKTGIEMPNISDLQANAREYLTPQAKAPSFKDKIGGFLSRVGRTPLSRVGAGALMGGMFLGPIGAAIGGLSGLVGGNLRDEQKEMASAGLMAEWQKGALDRASRERVARIQAGQGSAQDREAAAMISMGVPAEWARKLAYGAARMSTSPVDGSNTIVDLSTGREYPVSWMGGASSSPWGGGPVNDPISGVAGVTDGAASTAKGPRLWDLTEETGLVSGFLEGASGITGQFNDDFVAKDTIRARQKIRTSKNDFLRGMALNPRFPVAEIERLSEEINIEPSIFDSPESLRSRLRSIDESLRERLANEQAASQNRSLPVETQKNAAQAAKDITNFLNLMGVPEDVPIEQMSMEQLSGLNIAQMSRAEKEAAAKRYDQLEGR